VQTGAVVVSIKQLCVCECGVTDANVERPVSWTLKPSGTCANRSSCSKQKAIVCVKECVCVVRDAKGKHQDDIQDTRRK
jgi:hypothetical protein